MATSNVYKKKPRGGFNRGYQRSFSDTKPRNNNTAPTKEDYGIFNNPELLHLICRGVIGTIVEVTTVEDKKLYGLVKCASPAGGFGIELSHPPPAKVCGKNQTKQSNLLLIEAQDIKCMVIRDVNLEDCFKNDVVTDQEISNKNQLDNGNKKPHTILTGKPGVLNLQPFFQNESPISEKTASSKPESVGNGDSSLIPEESLDDSKVEKKGDHWFPPQDMFHVNQEKYRVSSSYQEDMEQYTIKIDTKSPDYAEKATRAEKLANEIDKGTDIENGNEDNEENLFSAVDKSPIEKQCEDSPTEESKDNQLSNSDMQTESAEKEKDDDETNKISSTTDSNNSDCNTQNPAYLNPEAPVFMPLIQSPAAAPIFQPPPFMRPPLMPHNPAAPIIYPSAPMPVDPQHHHPMQPFNAFVLPSGSYPYPYDPLQYISVSGHQQYMAYPPGALHYPAYYSPSGMPSVMNARGVPVTAPGIHPALMYPPHVYHHAAMHHPMLPNHQSNHRSTSSAASVISNSSHSTGAHNHTKNTSTSP